MRRLLLVVEAEALAFLDDVARECEVMATLADLPGQLKAAIA